MLTALTIENVENKKWYKKIFYKLRGNSIRVDIKSARGVVLRNITYINRNGRIDWYALDSEIGTQRNHLLCDESIILPENRGFKRFENTEFKIQLACNLGVFVLSKLKGVVPDIKVGLFDADASCSSVLEDLVKYCKNVVAVSDNVDEYTENIQKISEECGAEVFVSSNRANLSDCNLVIAPARITEALPISGGAIVLSGFAPTVCTAGLVYFDYHFRMPNMFDKIKPESLSNEYFAGALYTKGRQYELGSIVATTCSNFTSSQTPRSICDYLARMSAG
ncbi:MAG: hypothetical protein J1E41_08235 [Ruminococcus sp.]|nr:hypothetical protein [Ruminococcus sp.]